MNGIYQLNKYDWVMFQFGFESFKDFTKSLFGTWYKELIFAVSIIFGYAYLGADIILHNIDTYFYSPASAAVFTITVIFADWAVAVYGAFKTKTFETKKAQRIIPMIAANFLMLAGLFNMKKYLIIPLNMDIVTGAFSFFILFTAFYLAAVHFVSAVVNAGRIGLIDGKIVKFIMDYVDKKKQEIEKNL